MRVSVTYRVAGLPPEGGATLPASRKGAARGRFVGTRGPIAALVAASQMLALGGCGGGAPSEETASAQGADGTDPVDPDQTPHDNDAALFSHQLVPGGEALIDLGGGYRNAAGQARAGMNGYIRVGAGIHGVTPPSNIQTENSGCAEAAWPAAEQQTPHTNFDFYWDKPEAHDRPTSSDRIYILRTHNYFFMQVAGDNKAQFCDTQHMRFYPRFIPRGANTVWDKCVSRCDEVEPTFEFWAAAALALGAALSLGDLPGAARQRLGELLGGFRGPNGRIPAPVPNFAFDSGPFLDAIVAGQPSLALSLLPPDTQNAVVVQWNQLNSRAYDAPVVVTGREFLSAVPPSSRAGAVTNTANLAGMLFGSIDATDYSADPDTASASRDTTRLFAGGFQSLPRWADVNLPQASQAPDLATILGVLTASVVVVAAVVAVVVLAPYVVAAAPVAAEATVALLGALATRPALPFCSTQGC